MVSDQIITDMRKVFLDANFPHGSSPAGWHAFFGKNRRSWSKPKPPLTTTLHPENLPKTSKIRWLARHHLHGPHGCHTKSPYLRRNTYVPKTQQLVQSPVARFSRVLKGRKKLIVDLVRLQTFLIKHWAVAKGKMVICAVYIYGILQHPDSTTPSCHIPGLWIIRVWKFWISMNLNQSK